MGSTSGACTRGGISRLPSRATRVCSSRIGRLSCWTSHTKAIVTTKSRKQKQSQTRVGFRHAQARRRTACGSRCPGTPCAENLRTSGARDWLRPEIYTGYWRWAEKFFDIESNGFGRTIGDIKP